MFAPDDTIVAIATPPGRGGIGVVRISGPRAHRRSLAADRCTARAARAARRATFTRARRRRRRRATPHDDVVATCVRGAALLHRRGRRRDQRARQPGACSRASCAPRCAPARGWREPGEFTLRAFLNGKRDLSQAEAVADLDRRGDAAAGAGRVRSARRHADARASRRSTPTLFDLIARLEASLDFPDEGYHFIEPARRRRTRDASSSRGSTSCSRDAARGRMIREGAPS